MPLEIGSIVNGKVTGVTKFGAFVELEDGGTGLVHISEISQEYVTEISDYVNPGDLVAVKVINLDGGKIGLSMKQAKPPAKAGGAAESGAAGKEASPAKARRHARTQVYRGQPKREAPQSFEDMLSRFKQSSEERMSDIKRNMDGKRGSYSRRR